MEICPIFIDETGILSGSPQQQPVYGIGALIVPEPKEITNSLYRLHFNFSAARSTERQALRKRIESQQQPPTLRELDQLMHSTRHHEYKFTEVTRFHLQQYIDLLNLYFEFPDLQFHAVILDRLNPNYSLSKWAGDVWQAYANLARELLEKQLDRDVFAIVDLQDKPDKSPLYLEDTLCSTTRVKGCLRATSDMSVFLQLVDVLLGCVQFDWRDARGLYSPSSKRAREKRDLVNFVKARLGLQGTDQLLPIGEPSQRWDTPSLFTVYESQF